METQVTAEELADSIIDKIIDADTQEKFTYDLVASFIKDGLIEFAKYHVQKCKEEIEKNVKITINGETIFKMYGGDAVFTVDKQSILDAYNLDNIK